MEKMWKYCVVCSKEYGPAWAEPCCAPDSLVATKRGGMFKKRIEYFSLDGKPLTEDALAEIRKFETARAEREKSKRPIKYPDPAEGSNLFRTSVAPNFPIGQPNNRKTPPMAHRNLASTCRARKSRRLPALTGSIAACLVVTFLGSSCSFGPTPGTLRSAARQGNAASVKAALDSAASSNGHYQKWEVQQSFLEAIDKGNSEMAVVLLEAGADPNNGMGNALPMQRALQRHNMAILQALFDHGGRLPDNALELTINGNSDPTILALLLSKGADSSRTFKYQYRKRDSIESKVDNTPHPEYDRLSGETRIITSQTTISAIYTRVSGEGSILFLAAASGDRKATEFFLAQGVDPSQFDNRGRTAATVAEDSGHPELAALLRRPPSRKVPR